MKTKVLYFLIALLLTAGKLQAQWTNVGTPGFSAGQADFQSLAFHPTTQQPYVAYEDGGNSSKTTVMRFNGTNWVNVGAPGFSAGQADFQSLAFHPTTHQPYVAYSDGANGYKTTVMRFNGTNWVNVGAPGFSAGQAYNQSLAFHPTTHEPYVAYEDGGNGSKTTVMRFNGTNWVNVGTPGFSAGQAYEQSLAFHPTAHEPYVAYRDVANVSKATVMRFNGTNWVNVGAPGFSAGIAHRPSLAFHPTAHEPYVAYRDGGNGFGITVMRFDGTNWVNVGTPGFSAGTAIYQSLAFHPTTHEPYVAYRDDGNGNKTTVMRFDGTNWVNVGAPGFSAGYSDSQSLAFHPTTHEPYVAYRDGANGYKATVMRFAVPDISVFGNGTAIVSGSMTVSLANHTDFGSLAACTGSSLTRTFTIQNTGTGTLNLTGSPLVNITGAGAAMFSVTAVPAASVAPSLSTTFNITYQPTAPGTHTATVSIVSNDPDTPNFTFVIQGVGTDTVNPVIACVGNQSVNTNPGVCTFTQNTNAWNPTTSDNCSIASTTYTLTGATTGTGTTLNGAVFNLGTTTVTWTTTDGSGNTASCSFNVVVADNQNPVIACVGNQNVNADPGVCTYTQNTNAWDPTPTDNCSVASTTYALTGATTGTGTSLNGAVFNLGTTTVTWTTTDGSGNTATCSFTVTVTDNQNPTITAPAAVSVNTDAGLCTASSVALGTPTTADNCSVASVTNSTPTAFPLGTTTVTWTVTDGSGNTATDVQVVNVSFAGALTYDTSTFTESTPTSGQMGNSITITAPCPIFAGANGDDFVANGWVSVTNIPAGLTAAIVKIDNQTLVFSLVGTANPHTTNENVTNLTVVFNDSAFLFGSLASNITGSTRNDLEVTFANPIVGNNFPTCPEVENLVATPLSSSSILLTWNLPNGVERVEIRSGNDFIATVLAPQNSFVVEGLNHSTMYYFQLETTCGAGFSNVGTQEVAVRARTLPTGASLESVREVCGSGRVILSVSGKTDWQGVYRWYENETDTTPIFESADGIFETPVLTESKTYFVSIFELGQEGAKVPVIALVNEAYEARVLNTLNADNELLSCENFVMLQGEETAGARYAWKLNGSILGGENAPSLQAKVSGLYEFVVMRGNCMVESAPIRVRLKVAPLAMIQTLNNEVRFCSETVLSAAPQANPDADVSYEWSMNGTILGTAAAITASETGTYRLKVTDNVLGCAAINERRIEILNFPASVDLTASKTAICEGESAILSAPEVEGARYYWFLDNERLPLSGASIEASQGGIYRVTVFTPTAPCSAESAEFELTYYAAPKIRIRPNGNVLEVELSENVPFVWQVLDRNLGKNGEFVSIAGSENQVIFTPTQNGSYRILATYGQNCQVASRSKNFAAITLGEEEEIPQNQGFSLFPNPTQNRVTLRFESNQKDLQVRLYDALGRELLRQTWTNAQEVSLDLGKFANAVYTLQIISDQMPQTIKIVKE